MNRIDELQKVFETLDPDIKIIIYPMLDDVVFIERQLKELRKLPMIRVKPDDPSIQKNTPAAKLYKEYVQQLSNIVKLLIIAVRRDDEGEAESPLRAYLQSLKQ